MHRSLPEDTKIKWVCDENSPKVTVRELSSTLLADSKPELASVCLRWLCQEQRREMIHYLANLSSH